MNLYACTHVYPCHQNRGKIDDFIAIPRPINCEVNRDKIAKTSDFLSGPATKPFFYEKWHYFDEISCQNHVILQLS